MNTTDFRTGHAVTFPSGTEILTGTVTRVSPTSVWAVLNGREYRFVRSQDGQFRRYGNSDNQFAAVLSPVVPEKAPVEAEEAPAETVSIKAVDFTEEQDRLTELTTRVLWLRKSWDEADLKARAKVSEGNSLSSFLLDELVEAAARQTVRRTMAAFQERISEVVTLSETLRITEILDWDKFQEFFGYIKEEATDRFMDWYQPNSTSNVSVEISLAEHAAWQQLMKVASGKRF
jgi:uncharacterized protein (DUF1778 family)